MAGQTFSSTAAPGSAQYAIDQSALGRFQMIAIFVLMGLNGLDGFDAFAINFASPGIAADWGVDKKTLGFIKSMNLIGMGFGSLLIAPLADRFGRRPVILICTGVLSISMLACAFVETVLWLSIWRVITGLGIGAMLASITAMAAEFSNMKYRALCVSISACGYLIGSVLGGLASAELLEVYSWRSIFIFGGIISALYIPVIAWRVPETIAFLSGRQLPGDLQLANQNLQKMGLATVKTLGPKPDKSKMPLVRLFSGSMAMVTIAVTLAYFFQIITFYYFVGWVPDILVDLGYSQADATRVLTAASFGGVFGALGLGWVASRIGMTLPTSLAAVMGGILVWRFGASGADLLTLSTLGVGAGFFMNASIVMCYALMARAFPADIRALGSGFVLGVGRTGGVLGPILGGFLFQASVDTGSASLIMACGAFACGAIVLTIGPALRRQENSLAKA